MGVPKSGRWRGGKWKLAPALVAMEAQADLLAPRRRRTSDGSIGDHAHSVRRSDHNPDEEGNTDWVDALDISHDPANGMDIHARLRVIARNVKNGIEKRVSYLISNDEIFSEENGVWAWRPYGGTNPHKLHGHISVNDQYRHDTSPWFDSSPPFPTPPPAPPPYVPPAQSPAPVINPFMEDTMYIRDRESGAIYALSATHWDHLSGEQWADRVREGARAFDMHPLEVLARIKSRIRVQK